MPSDLPSISPASSSSTAAPTGLPSTSSALSLPVSIALCYPHQITMTRLPAPPLSFTGAQSEPTTAPIELLIIESDRDCYSYTVFATDLIAASFRTDCHSDKLSTTCCANDARANYCSHHDGTNA